MARGWGGRIGARLKALLWCWFACLALAMAMVVRPASAEVFYGIDNNNIYSVDILQGGPLNTLYTFSPALTSGVTLAVRPSDGLLFFLNTQGANPTLRSWNPANPTVAPVVIGTLGTGVTGVIRLGFDAANNLYASNGGASGLLWQVDPNTGAILSATPLSGAVTGAGSGDICLQPGTGTLFMVASGVLFTINQSTAVVTQLGTMTGAPGSTGCAFDSTGRLVISGGGSQLYSVDLSSSALTATALPQTTGTASFGDLATGPSRTADLRLTKTATNITPTNTVSFTITVTNDGPDRATAVRVLDVLPAGVTFVSSTASQGVYNTAATTIAPNTVAYPAGTWVVGTLNNGASATLTINATVAAGTTTATNTAQVSFSDQRDPDSTPNNSVATEDDQASVTINRSPDLQVEKSVPGTLVSGTNSSYTFTVNNLVGSASTSAAYTITDNLPTGLTLATAGGGAGWTVPAGWSCNANSPATGDNIAGGSRIVCTNNNSTPLTTSGAGATSSAVVVPIAVSAAAIPSVSNTVTVSGGGELGTTNFTSNNSFTLVTAVCTTNCPDLRPNKTSSSSSLTVGTAASYTISVSNVGGLPTVGTYTITDTLPTGITLAANSPGTGTGGGWTIGAGWTCTASAPNNVSGGSIISCNSSTVVNAGATSSTIVVPVNVGTAAVNATGSVTNTVTVSGGGDPNVANNSASVVTPVIDFDLTISKTTASAFALGGANPSYTITVSNLAGGRNITSTTGSLITVTDVLPAGLGFVSATGTNWTCNNVSGNVTCTLNNGITINTGASAPAITLTVSINNAIGSSVTNTATVSKSDEASPVKTGNNSASVVSAVAAPDLIVTKTHTGNFVVGQTGTYTITVFNNGTQNTSGTITVTDTLPANVTYISTSGNATGTGWTCNTAPVSPASTQTVTCTSSTVINAGSAGNSITLPVRGVSVGTSNNVVTVSGGNEPTGNNGNNSDSDSTAVFVTPTITKAFAPASVVAGVTSVLTFTIANTSTSTATGVAFIDPFPAGMAVTATPGITTNGNCGTFTFASGSAQGDTVFSVSGGTIPASSTCTVSVNVSSTTVGANNNVTGEVSTTNSGTSSTTAASRTATLTVIAPPAPVLSKLSNPNPVGVNRPSALTFTIVKSGAVSNNNMAFIDTFPNGVVYQSTVSTSAGCGGGLVFQNHLSAALVAGAAGIRVSNIDMGTNTLCTIVINVSSATAGTYANTNANISGLLNGLTSNVNDTLEVVGTTLTKGFSPATVAIGQSSNLTFTITNGTSAPQQSGLAFTETLPMNVVVASVPTPTQCSGMVTATVGGSTISFSGGAMAAGLASCTIVVPVKSGIAGTYNNLPANVTGVSAGMINNATATLTVNSGVALNFTKSVKTICDPVNFAGDGTTTFPRAIPGAYVQYTIKIENGAGAVNSATLTTINDVLEPFLNFDADLRTGTPSACATSPPENASGRAFAMTCMGGTRACNSTVYFTGAAADDAMGISGAAITLSFGDTPGNPKALPTEAGYAPGELKPGESVTIRFNAIVK